MTDGVIASQADQRTSFIKNFAHPRLNHVPRVAGGRKIDIAVIDDSPWRSKVHSRFRVEIVRMGEQFRPDLHWSLGRPFQERRILVVWDAKNRNAVHIAVIALAAVAACD
jgi:hypothetical protein